MRKLQVVREGEGGGVGERCDRMRKLQVVRGWWGWGKRITG
jgi:hypothetical protein